MTDHPSSNRAQRPRRTTTTSRNTRGSQFTGSTDYAHAPAWAQRAIEQQIDRAIFVRYQDAGIGRRQPRTRQSPQQQQQHPPPPPVVEEQPIITRYDVENFMRAEQEGEEQQQQQQQVYQDDSPEGSGELAMFAECTVAPVAPVTTSEPPSQSRNRRGLFRKNQRQTPEQQQPQEQAPPPEESRAPRPDTPGLVGRMGRRNQAPPDGPDAPPPGRTQGLRLPFVRRNVSEGDASNDSEPRARSRRRGAQQNSSEGDGGRRRRSILENLLEMDRGRRSTEEASARSGRTSRTSRTTQSARSAKTAKTNKTTRTSKSAHHATKKEKGRKGRRRKSTATEERGRRSAPPERQTAMASQSSQTTFSSEVAVSAPPEELPSPPGRGKEELEGAMETPQDVPPPPPPPQQQHQRVVQDERPPPQRPADLPEEQPSPPQQRRHRPSHSSPDQQQSSPPQCSRQRRAEAASRDDHDSPPVAPIRHSPAGRRMHHSPRRRVSPVSEGHVSPVRHGYHHSSPRRSPRRSPRPSHLRSSGGVRRLSPMRLPLEPQDDDEGDCGYDQVEELAGQDGLIFRSVKEIFPSVDDTRIRYLVKRGKSIRTIVSVLAEESVEIRSALPRDMPEELPTRVNVLPPHRPQRREHQQPRPCPSRQSSTSSMQVLPMLPEDGPAEQNLVFVQEAFPQVDLERSEALLRERSLRTVLNILAEENLLADEMRQSGLIY